MLATNAYLIGIIGLGLVYIVLFFARKDLRRIMIYSGTVYLLYGFIIFLAIKLLATDGSKAINPGYWTPPTLFNLNSRTGGYGIEDALFSFFAGGVAACLYDLIFKVNVSKKTNKKLRKGHALLFALLLSSLIFVVAPFNAIYLFIFLQLFGTMAILWQRPDLLKNSLIGGLFFMTLYGALFLIFNALFPSFIDNYYHLLHTSQISILGLPLEELLYALTLGMMWAPLYEYEHRLRTIRRN